MFQTVTITKSFSCLSEVLAMYNTMMKILKTLIRLSRLWPLPGWRGLSESVKKGKFVTKILFQMLNEVLKICEKCYC